MRNFGKFYRNNKPSGFNKTEFKTYSMEEIKEQNLGLEDGINSLPDAMRSKLEMAGVKDLFPVQTSTFSLFVKEENELIVKSRTGTGKTLSFLLPLEYLLKHSEESQNDSSRKVKAIILEPTRELAIQVQTQVDKFTSLRSSLLYGGGESKDIQYRKMR